MSISELQIDFLKYNKQTKLTYVYNIILHNAHSYFSLNHLINMSAYRAQDVII